MASYTFSILETLPSIHEPLKYLSVSSANPTWQQNQNWPAHCYYHENGSDQLQLLLTHLQSSGNFSLCAENDNDKLVYTSESPQLTLTLKEATYSHNAYLGRYLRFTKHIPPKYSPDLETFYTASVSLDANTKYFKDFNVLLARVFSVCSICLLLDNEVPFPLTKVIASYLSTSIASHSEVCPLSTTEILSEDSHELYEYLCLLHLNGLPDYENSHVQATTRYEIPPVTAPLISENDIESLYLQVTENINPSALKALVSSEGWVSAFVRSDNHNIVLMRTQKGIYIWHVHS